jgi:cytoskeletal protein CcmA (bactofilin family)
MADVTVVGQGMFLRGSIRGEGDLDIRGRIEGEVDVVGEVTIGDGALVKANVSGRRITVRGAVAGNLTGEDAVRLEEGARVVGDLRGASIGIAEGALLRGNVQTGQAGEAQKGRARTASAARAAVRAEPRKSPAQAPAQAASAAKGNGSPRKIAPAAVPERTGPPPPVVPALKKGARAALRKRSR